MFASRLIAVTIFVFATFTACEKPRPVAADAKPQQEGIQLPSLPPSREVDDTARFFAGLPAKAGSPYAELQGEFWDDHKRQMDAAWAKTDSELLVGLKEFQSKELSLPIVAGRTVFYPFSGPDTLTETQYFPNAPLYIMVGLEPPGTLPTPQQVEKKKDRAEYLAAMRQTMSSILGRSFFVTREMDRELRGQVTDGILLPMLHLLVRTNHDIIAMRYVRIDDDGNVVERPADYKPAGKYANRGVEVEFQTPNGRSQHAYYFSVNLDDQHMRDNAGFKAFLAHATDTLSMLKATSYMTHQPGFSRIRDHVLANSALIVQDDSGIPYRFFTPDQWKVTLYGDYIKPYGSFRYLEQKDLRAAFQEGKARDLPMHIGYGYRKITSNLEVAIRTDAKPLVAMQAKK